MKTVLALGLLLALSTLCGCAATTQRALSVNRALYGDLKAPVMPPAGVVWTSYRAPLDVGPTDFGSKTGRATSHQIGLPPLPFYGLTRGVSLFAWGDASKETAARQGGITEIEHADYRLQIFVFVYKRFTTEVYGD